MAKRLSTHTSKRSSAFNALIQAHSGPSRAGERATIEGPPGKGKSSDPDFVKLTSYIRRETHKAVKRRLLDENKEISQLVQELLEQWLAARP